MCVCELEGFCKDLLCEEVCGERGRDCCDLWLFCDVGLLRDFLLSSDTHELRRDMGDDG